MFQLLLVATTSLAVACGSGDGGTASDPVAFAVGGKRVSRSDDQGASWREILNIGTGSLRGIDFVDAATGWVVGTRAIYHTRTGGEGEWEDQTPNIEGDEVSLSDVVFLDRARGVAGGLGIGPNGGTGAIVLVTSDGGAHWRRRTVGRPQTAVSGLCLSPNGAGAAVGRSVFLPAVGRFLLTTDDGGESWTDVTDAVRDAAGSPFVLVNCEHLAPSRLWVVGEDSLLVESMDGGATWSRRVVTNRPDVRLSAVRFVDRETGWISGWEGGTGEVVIFRTDDAGATWDEQVVDHASVLTALPAAALAVLGPREVLFVGDDPATLTVGPRPYSFVSRDAGATWTGSVIPDGYSTFNDVDAVR